MRVIEGSGVRDADYFGLNVSAMQVTLDVMTDLDLVAWDVEHSPLPERPEGDWMDSDEASDAWAEFFAAEDAVLGEHPNLDDPRLPGYKLCTNDRWVVTPVECRALVDMARDGRCKSYGDLPRWWDDWIDYIDRASTRGGFEVR